MAQGLADGAQRLRIIVLPSRQDAPNQLERRDGITLALAGQNYRHLAQDRARVQRAALLDVRQHLDRELRDMAHGMAEQANQSWLVPLQLLRHG